MQTPLSARNFDRCSVGILTVAILTGVLVLTAGCAERPWSFSFGQTPPSRLEHISEAKFEERVLKAQSPVVVDFYADWCGPCQKLGPVLEDFAQEHPEIRVVKVNIDENRELAARYEVKSLPSLIVIRGGQVTARSVGLIDKARIKTLAGIVEPNTFSAQSDVAARPPQ